MALARRNRLAKRVEERENGWDLSSCRTTKLPEYNALFDPNMRHYFENRVIQKHLHTSGQVNERVPRGYSWSCVEPVPRTHRGYVPTHPLLFTPPCDCTLLHKD